MLVALEKEQSKSPKIKVWKWMTQTLL